MISKRKSVGAMPLSGRIGRQWYAGGDEHTLDSCCAGRKTFEANMIRDAMWMWEEKTAVELQVVAN